METAVWVDGRLVEPGQAAIRADDHALVGGGVFEAIKVVDRQPFALTRHLRRMAASSEPLGLEVPFDTVRTAVDEILATPAAGRSPCWLRITVTTGSAPMASGERGTPTVVAAVAPMASWPRTATAVVVPWARNDRGATTGLKTISYADNAIALRYAHAHGADEALFGNTRDQLCEGAGSNVAVVLDGRLVTPPLSSGCLAGVTRELLLEWFGDLKEDDVPLDRLGEVEEAFLTSTSRDVHPIASLDGRDLPALGPATAEAMAVFAERVREDVDP